MNILRASLFPAVVLLAFTTSTSAQTMRGYTAASAAKQRQIEKQLIALPSAERARQQHRYFTESRIRRVPSATTNSHASSPTSGSNKAGKT